MSGWHSIDFRDKEVRHVATADPCKLKEALQSNPELPRSVIGFSFSGGGFLLPYHLACIRALKDIGLLVQHSDGQGTPQQVGGASAGSLAAAVVACDLDLDVVDEAVDEMTEECRRQGTWTRLGPCLRLRLDKLLPEDAHVRCSGRLHVAVSKVKPWGQLKCKRATHFESRDDLIDALMASCHLPILSNGRLTTSFRGRRVADGGFTDVMPVVQHPSVLHVVKISCLLVEMVKTMPMLNRKTGLRHIAISPCMYNDWPFSVRETLKAAIGPGSKEMVSSLRRAGDRDVRRWWKDLTTREIAVSPQNLAIDPW